MRPDLRRGDRVRVREDGIREWAGEVLSVKPTRKAWRVEVRDSDRLVWILLAKHTERVG